MSKNVISVDAHELTGAALERMDDAGVHYLAIQDDGELVGVVCACDLVACFPDRGVQSACRSPPVFVDSECSLRRAKEVMETCGVGSLLVIDEGVLHGIVTASDLIRAGLWERDPWSCASCGAHHHLLGDGVKFCVDCLEQTRSDGPRKFYFTLGGGD